MTTEETYEKEKNTRKGIVYNACRNNGIFGSIGIPDRHIHTGARRKCGGRLHDQHRKDISEDPRLRRNEPPRVAEL